MSRNIELELNDLKSTFPSVSLRHWKEGGVDFFEIDNLLGEGVETCVLQVGNFLGYQSRLFYPKMIDTKNERNWNHKNILIKERKYFAYSYRVPDGTLTNILLSHLGGLN